MALNKVSIRDFRNIGNLTLQFRDTASPVAVNVIQGPNGTGESSISEAISIALSRVSSCYIDFLSDSNEGAPGKAGKYIERYLTPLNHKGAEPKVGLNEDPKPITLVEADAAEQRFVARCDSRVE